MRQRESSVSVDKCVFDSNDARGRLLASDILGPSISFLTAVLIAVVAYGLSAGPVFAYTCALTSSSSASICPCYRPLFRIVPKLTARYLNCWGVSDLEAYFLLATAQLGHPESEQSAGEQ